MRRGRSLFDPGGTMLDMLVQLAVALSIAAGIYMVSAVAVRLLDQSLATTTQGVTP